MPIKNYNSALVIVTDSTKTLQSIGLSDGVFYFSDSDSISPDSLFEDGSPVDNYAKFTPIILENGISNSGSQIDIIDGGDYAYLQELTVTISNRDMDDTISFVDAVTYLEDVFLEGATVTRYVILDDVFYPRWSGTVAEMNFSDSTVSIVCEDRHIAIERPFPRNTIGDAESSENSEGETIPVIIGGAKYVKLTVKKEITEPTKTEFLPLEYVATMPTLYSYDNYMGHKCLDKISFSSAGYDPNLAQFEDFWGNAFLFDNILKKGNILYAVRVVGNFGGLEPTAYIGKSLYFSQYYTSSENEKISEEATAKIVGAFGQTFIIDGIPKFLECLYGKDIFNSENPIPKEAVFVSIIDGFSEYIVSDSAVTLEIPKENPQYIYETSGGKIQFYTMVDDVPTPVSLKADFDGTTIKLYEFENAIDQVLILPKRGFWRGCNDGDEYNVDIDADTGGQAFWQTLKNSIVWKSEGKTYNEPLGFLDGGDWDLVNSSSRNGILFNLEFDSLNIEEWDSVVPVITLQSHIVPPLRCTSHPSNWWAKVDFGEHRDGDSIYDIKSFFATNYKCKVFGSQKIYGVKYSVYPAGEFDIPIPLGQSRSFRISPENEDPRVPNYNYNTMSEFPTIGDSEVRYTAIDTGKEYKWNGTSYYEVPPITWTQRVSGEYFQNDNFWYMQGSIVVTTIPKTILDYSKQNFLDIHTYSGKYGDYPQVSYGFTDDFYIKNDMFYHDNKEPIGTVSTGTYLSGGVGRTTENSMLEVDKKYIEKFDTENTLNLYWFMRMNLDRDLNHYDNSSQATVLVPAGNAKVVSQLYTIGLLCQKRVSSLKDLYVRVVGVQDSLGEDVSTVYDAFKYLLSDVGSTVNYNNLPQTRDSWNVGKVIKEQRTLLTYIQELCRQSFVAGWTGRDGSINLDAFREQPEPDDALVIHDPNIIIAESLKDFTRSDITRVYNEFVIKYDYNEATDKYDKSFSITNVDQDVFPPIDGEWEKWVSGIGNYADAKRIWVSCRNGYLKNKRIGTAPVELTELSWFNDLSDFLGTAEDWTKESAYKNLLNRIEWSTQQQYICKYDLPITADTVKLNLMQRVKFIDPIITPNGYGVGWLTDIVMVDSEALIECELTFKKFLSRGNVVFCPNIWETGNDEDITITATGVSTDISIIEDANCRRTIEG